jgi:PAS domain S-box-containing protein
MINIYSSWLFLVPIAVAIVSSYIAIDLGLRLAAAKRALDSRAMRASHVDLSQADPLREVEPGVHAGIQSALRESEARFRSAFDFAAIGMALVSPQGSWLQVNRAICQLIGYSEQELLALTFQDVTHPDDLTADLSYVGQVLRGELDSYQMEKRYFHKQGHVVWVLLSVSLVRAEDGAPLHFVSQIQDISARKAAEQAVRESEERFQLVVAGTHDGIWDWNIVSGECYYSPRYTQLLGYADHEVPPIRQSFESWLHPEDRDRTFATLRAHFEARVPYAVEYRLRAKSGAYAWFQASGQASWDAQGNPVRFTGSLRDITERVRADERLNRNAELLRQTGQMAKIGGWERDLTTNIPVWTDEVRAIVGVGPDFQPTLETAHQF